MHRQEVYVEIQRANREAMDVASAGLEGAQQLINRDTKAGGSKVTTGHPEGAKRPKDARKHMEVKHGT